MQAPRIDELRSISESFGFGLGEADLESFRGLMEATLESYDFVERASAPDVLPVRYPRDGGRRPSAEENPYNAWYQRTAVQGADDGPLKGKTVALKDNIPLAGVPMANGSATLEGYVPEFDATVVTRVLDAGGTIAGKAVCEDMCFSGSSHTAITGPIENPRRPGYGAGGSSSGCAAVLAAGDVDLALGCDQGGSIRTPASFCGVVGLKPTFGLVPYTGIFPMEFTLDHCGPMARTVADAALLLEVVAGRDPLDPRQPTVVPTERYTDAIGRGLDGIRIGVVSEGFGWESTTPIAGETEVALLSEPEIDERVRGAVDALGLAGADVSTVSIPLHRNAAHIWNVIAVEGVVDFMLKGHALGTNWKGFYPTSMLEAYRHGLMTRAGELADTVKLVALLGEHLHRTYGGRHYAMGQNLAPTLVDAYDRALADVDVLVMPTTPTRAKPLPTDGASREEKIALALEMVSNTCPFDVTGHPAISVPCHEPGELPIGMMIIGRRFADAQVLRVASAYEELRGGWS